MVGLNIRLIRDIESLIALYKLLEKVSFSWSFLLKLFGENFNVNINDLS